MRPPDSLANIVGAKGASKNKSYHIQTAVLCRFKAANGSVQRGEFYDSHGDDTSQLGGDFIVDKNGSLQLVYPSHDPADRPSVEELVKVLKEVNTV